MKSNKNRREERIKLMSLIYELDIKESENLASLDIGDLSEYQLFVLEIYLEHKSSIDQRIKDSLRGWNMESIAKVELAILRLCLVEALYVEEVPYKVAINEAIEIAKLYADDKAPKFINGVIRKCVDSLDV
ncbi:MAG: transcription antitermination factor NusB [Bacillota bacterium]|nr:transcription antitermination factor NusB [Bacillota bacterium]